MTRKIPHTGTHRPLTPEEEQAHRLQGERIRRELEEERRQEQAADGQAT